jgi:hypothetical protein
MPFIGELGVITREREAHRWRQCQQSASLRMPHPAVAGSKKVCNSSMSIPTFLRLGLNGIKKSLGR